MQHTGVIMRAPGSLAVPKTAGAALQRRLTSRAPAHARRVQLQCRAQKQTVPVRIRVRVKVHYGEHVRVVGNLPQMGEWDPERAPELTWGPGDVWSAQLELPVGVQAEFKCVCTGGNRGSKWEDGSNRRFKPLGPDYGLDLACRWGRADKTVISSVHLAGGSAPDFDAVGPALVSSDGDSGADEVGGSGEEERERQRQRRQRQRSEARNSGGSMSSDEDAPGVAWQGRDIAFMRSNQHSHERSGRWDTSRLAVGSAARKLVEGDEKSPNWLGKLTVARKVLVDDAPRQRPGVDALAAGFVYLQWVATGALECAEGGGHYRPNHHARVGQAIFRSLEWVMADDSPPGAATLLARRLHTRLPSFSEAFTQQVPLTRIRDIAHRNDIPSDLKQEIKHTLQNKLHRNAGPEDLIATELMLRRITASPGQYSGAFVEQFQIFAAELRDFFNAGSLTSVLDALRPSLADPNDQQVLDFFLQQKAALDSKGGGARVEDVVAVLHALTTLRALLVTGLSSGMRNDAPDASIAMRQRWRLGELRCESYFFVLLSRFDNMLESSGGAASLASGSDLAWGQPLGALVLGLRHTGLSGWQPGECMALERELAAWHTAGAITSNRDNALRLKASLERLQRLCEAYTDELLRLLPQTAELLGEALGVEEHAFRTFTEAEVRASVVFQLSKLATTLLKAVRIAAGTPAWQPLVAGTAIGRLVEAERLEPAALAAATEPVVMLLRRADGDEEVSAAGPLLRGVVLAQDLPHLSHLGVRARQEHVPFATLDDEGTLSSQVKPLLGQLVTLEVKPDGVALRPASAQELRAAEASAAAAASNGNGNGAAGYANGNGASNGNGAAAGVGALVVERVSAPLLVGLREPGCRPGLVGAKAAACGALEQVAARSSGAAQFSTPPGCVVPFGVMEAAAGAAGRSQQLASLLARSEVAGLAELEGVCAELQDLVSGLQLPPQLTAAVAAAFPGSDAARLIARSSANVEDLAGMSGAGLYDSIPNVPPGQAADVSAAVAGVWASLYTRRAVLSRRVAGVHQSDACMAVLLQQLLEPSLSFVLHTANPIDGNAAIAVVELAAGLGETLASGTHGSAWRLAVDKASGKVSTLAFANFSQALLPAGAAAAAALPLPVAAGGGSLYAPSTRSQDGGGGGGGQLYECSSRTVDYSRQQLSVSVEAREALGRRIGALAGLLEAEFGGAQDVEGCFVGDVLYVVQARPQPL